MRWFSAAVQMDREAHRTRALELQEEGEAFLGRQEYAKASERLRTVVSLMDGIGDAAVRPLLGLAFARHCEGKLDEAEASYRRAISLLEEEGGKETAATIATAKTNLADLLSHKEDVAGAEVVAREALPLVEEAHGEGELLAALLQNLSTYLAVQNRFDEALPFAERALSLFEEHLGRHNPYTQGTLRTLLRLHLDRGDQAAHDGLKARWTDADTSDLAEAREATAKVGEKMLESVSSILNLEEAKKSLDPSGAMVPPPLVQKELEAFKQRWASDTDNGKGLEAKDAAYLARFEKELQEVKELLHSSVAGERPNKSKFEGLSPEELDEMDEDSPVLQKMAEEELVTFARKFEGKHEVDLDIASIGFSNEALKAAGIEPTVVEEAGEEASEKKE